MTPLGRLVPAVREALPPRPLVPITDLAVKDNALIVATQGRSIWMIDDLTVLHQLLAAGNTSAKTARLFDPKDAYRTKGRGGRASLTAGTNLPNGVITHFYLPEGMEQDSVVLNYHNAAGDLIRPRNGFWSI